MRETENGKTHIDSNASRHIYVRATPWICIRLCKCISSKRITRRTVMRLVHCVVPRKKNMLAKTKQKNMIIILSCCFCCTGIPTLVYPVYDPPFVSSHGAPFMFPFYICWFQFFTKGLFLCLKLPTNWKPNVQKNIRVSLKEQWKKGGKTA
jgi:hypothetical protein